MTEENWTVIMTEKKSCLNHGIWNTFLIILVLRIWCYVKHLRYNDIVFFFLITWDASNWKHNFLGVFTGMKGWSDILLIKPMYDLYSWPSRQVYMLQQGAEGWGVWMEPGHYLSCMKVTITFTFFCLPQTVKDISIFISYQQSIFRIPWYKMLWNYSFSEQLYQKSVKRKNLVFSQ